MCPFVALSDWNLLHVLGIVDLKLSLLVQWSKVSQITRTQNLANMMLDQEGILVTH